MIGNKCKIIFLMKNEKSICKTLKKVIKSCIKIEQKNGKNENTLN
jgi:hypothetical protein